MAKSGAERRPKRSKEELQEAIERGERIQLTQPDGTRKLFNPTGTKSGVNQLFMSNLSETGHAGEVDFIPTKKTEKFSFEEARLGFMGFVNNKTMFTVGEGNMKEFVSVKPRKKKNNNIFLMNPQFNVRDFFG